MATLTRDQAKAKADELGISYELREKTTSIIASINEVTGDGYTLAEATTAAPKPEATAAAKPEVTGTAAVGGSTAPDLREEPKEEEDIPTLPDLQPVNADGTVKCIIHSNDRDNDEVEVTGMLNGETYQVQLGEEIDFPIKLLPSINLAKEKQTIAILTEAGVPSGKYKIRWHKRYILERI